MTPTRLEQCLAALHWTKRGFAAIIGIDERQVRRWASGDYRIPSKIAEWLERRAEAALADPPP